MEILKIISSLIRVGADHEASTSSTRGPNGMLAGRSGAKVTDLRLRIRGADDRADLLLVSQILPGSVGGVVAAAFIPRAQKDTVGKSP